MSHRSASNIIAGICAAGAAFFFIESLSIRIDGGYPKLLCVVLFLLCAYTIVQNVVEGRAEAKKGGVQELKEEDMTTEERAEHMAKEAEEAVPVKDLAVVIAVSFGSVLLWKPLSFVVAGALGLFIISVYKKQPILKSALLAVCTVIVLQLVFRNIFAIPIPTPSWWPRF